MAVINCGSIWVDTEDIDLLVTYCTLGALDGALRFDAAQLEKMPENDPLRPWMAHRLESHKLALEIKESTINEGAKIVRPILMPKPIIEQEIIREAHKPKAKRKYEGIEL